MVNGLAPSDGAPSATSYDLNNVPNAPNHANGTEPTRPADAAEQLYGDRCFGGAAPFSEVGLIWNDRTMMPKLINSREFLPQISVRLQNSAVVEQVTTTRI